MLSYEDGRYLDAERDLRQVIDDLRASADPAATYELGRALLDRATVRRLLNRWADAGADVDACEELLPSLTQFAASSLRPNIEAMRAHLGLSEQSPTYDPSAAEKAVEALAATGSYGWLVREAEANLAFRKREWERAAAGYAEVGDALEREGWAQGAAASALRAGTALLELGRSADAEPQLRKSVAFFSEFGPTDLRADAERQLARLLSCQGRHDEAWAHSKAALALVETSFRSFRSLPDQQRFLADKGTYYQHAYAVALAAGGVEGVWRALAVAERSKSFYLCQLLANADVPLFDGVDPVDVERLRTLEDRLDELQSALAGNAGRTRADRDAERVAVAADRDELFARIMREHPRWAAARTPFPFDPERELAALPSGWSALSMFWFGDEELHMFLVRPGEPPFHRSERWSAEQLEALRLSQTELREASAGALWSHGPVIPEDLAQLVLPPEILQRIRPDDRLLLSPHGALRGVPIHAVAGAGNRPLLGLGVQYIPSLVLLGLVRPAREASSVLLVGCEQDGFGSNALTSVPRELEAVADKWAKSPATPVDLVLLDPTDRFEIDAAEQWSKYRIVHLACHGEFEPERPLEAALRLGRSALRTSELFALNLQAELVCLSACDLGGLGTGLADVKEAGDEWLGVTMPLLHAGARAILVSLWKADDDVAARLMPALHAALCDGCEPADALRDALATVADEPETYWSNWYLVGFPAGLAPRTQ
jgi:CHAT domain-containing protein/tetratricopeptide (TPR) repeat protein